KHAARRAKKQTALPGLEQSLKRAHVSSRHGKTGRGNSCDPQSHGAASTITFRQRRAAIHDGTHDRIMSAPATNAGQSWLSFHVFLPGLVEPFLVGYFLPALKVEQAARRVKRFFFIRYREGGLHLRLRFLTTSQAGPEVVGNWLNALVVQFCRQERIDPQ